MITREVFEYFQKIKASTDFLIPHEAFLPIRNKISIADASNYSLEDKDGLRFWNYIDELIECKLINDVHYIMEDLWTEQDEAESIDELFNSSEDAYLKYIIFKINLSEKDAEERVINTLNEKFSAECFINSKFGESTWCITWD